MSRTRSVCFTYNNYTPEGLIFFENLQQNESIEYIVFQEETGESGTPHLQGYCYARNPKSLEAWKKFFGSASGINPHIIFAKGTAAENRRYCTKPECRIPGTSPREHGTMPSQGKRNDLGAVMQSVHEGVPLREILERHPDEFIKFSRGIQVARLLTASPRRHKSEVFWLYGPTGTGKSRVVADVAPDAYWKNPTTKWWDGYDQHEDVIIDDYRRDFCTFADLLRLLDRYPLCLESKGGSFNFVAKRIFITTPRSPRDTWNNRTEEDLDQLLRRIEHVYSYMGISDPSSVVRLDVARSRGLAGQEEVPRTDLLSVRESLPGLFTGTGGRLLSPGGSSEDEETKEVRTKRRLNYVESFNPEAQIIEILESTDESDYDDLDF